MKHVIDRLGGTVAVARLCRISAPSVTFWRKYGIPIARCVFIERANSLGIKRWDLRPDDWHEIWPELVDVDGAPKPPKPTATAQEATHAV